MSKRLVTTGALINLVMAALLVTGCSDSSESEEVTRQAIADINAAMPEVLGESTPDADADIESAAKSVAGIAAMTQFGMESLDTWDAGTIGEFCADGRLGIQALGSLLHDRFPDYSLADAEEAASAVMSRYC